MLTFIQFNENYVQYDHITSTYRVLLKQVDEYFLRQIPKSSAGISPLETELMHSSVGRLSGEYQKDIDNPDRRLVRFQDLPIWNQYKKLTEKFIKQYGILKKNALKIQFKPTINTRSYEARKLRQSTDQYIRLKNNLNDTYIKIRELDDEINKQRKEFTKALLQGEVPLKNSSSQGSYDANDYGDDDQVDLMTFLNTQVSRRRLK